MWKRQEQERTPASGGSGTPPPASTSPMPMPTPASSAPGPPASIGRSVVMKGELSGSEDLVIDGQVEGTVNLRQHLLTIGPSAKISAEISAKAVIVLGLARGNITATERIEIRESGSVDGDISAPRVAIAEGAHFRGTIDMHQPDPAAGAARSRGADGAGVRRDTASRARGNAAAGATASSVSS
jgi:cytoskeletal protein CcmA (bactofilin family)